MIKSGFLALALLLSGVSTAHAESIPDAALRKDYENCMGGETATQSPDRARYCQCVIDEMRTWNTSDYASVNQQAAIQGAINAPPEKLAALGKSCFDKVMH